MKGSAMIDVREFFVVQSRLKPRLRTSEDRVDEPECFDEDGAALDWADYLREDGDTETRVVRRWN